MREIIDDPDVLAFIAETERAYGGMPANPSVAEERTGYARMCAAFRADRPEGLAVADGTIALASGPIGVRHYRKGDWTPDETEVIYFHGGGFVVGDLDSHDDVCAEIAHRTGCPVLSVDYRLAPEHPHPAAFEDALGVTLDRLTQGSVLLAGDSAGGALAASVSLALRGNERVRGQVLIYPGLGGRALRLASYTERAKAPLLAASDLERYDRLRAGGTRPLADPRFSALTAADFSRLAPCYASAADVDPLRDDAVLYARRLRAAGVPAEAAVEPQLPHGWLRARHRSARAAAAFTRIVEAVADLAGAPAASAR